MGKNPSLAERIEWAVGLVAAALVAILVGYLIWSGLTLSQQPPVLTIAPAPATGPGRLDFVVTNDGGRTATDVTIALRLRAGDGSLVAEHGLTIDYVPGSSAATGAFQLPKSAERLEPELSIEGYLDP
jgi:uncharacterized protein (TIGR02588 family)